MRSTNSRGGPSGSPAERASTRQHRSRSPPTGIGDGNGHGDSSIHLSRMPVTRNRGPRRADRSNSIGSPSFHRTWIGVGPRCRKGQPRGVMPDRRCRDADRTRRRAKHQRGFAAPKPRWRGARCVVVRLPPGTVFLVREFARAGRAGPFPHLRPGRQPDRNRSGRPAPRGQFRSGRSAPLRRHGRHPAPRLLPRPPACSLPGASTVPPVATRRRRFPRLPPGDPRIEPLFDQSSRPRPRRGVKSDAEPPDRVRPAHRRGRDRSLRGVMTS